MNSPKWLETAIFYEIYPQSFYDTNGDGIGDLNGIKEKLDYIKSIGCNAIWINPCFDSPFKDAGYDVRDYYKIAPRYGTNEDMYELLKVAHEKGIKILLISARLTICAGFRLRQSTTCARFIRTACSLCLILKLCAFTLQAAQPAHRLLFILLQKMLTWLPTQWRAVLLRPAATAMTLART